MNKTSIRICGFVGLLIVCFGSDNTFAQSMINDCDRMVNYFNRTQSEIQQRYGFARSSKNMDIAFDNLRANCCQQKNILNNELSQQFCEANKARDTDGRFPKSLFLYDHLIDVAFRSLDGDEPIYPGLQLDQQGRSWRKWIENQAQSPQGRPAMLFLAEYQKFWTGTVSSMAVAHRNPHCKSLVEGGNQYTFLPLSQRYSAQCAISYCIVQEVLTRVQSNPVTDNQVTQEYSQCLKLAQKRLIQENQYVQYFMVQQSSRFLHDNVSSYLSKYFVGNRILTLLEKISTMSDIFATVNQKSMQGTKQCSQ